MFRLFVVALFCVSALARPNPDLGIDPFVVGGTPAAEGQFPYIVSLRYSDKSLQCGGTLISDRWVLTAAHCITGFDLEEGTIGVGSANFSKQKLYQPDKIFPHPKYNSRKKTEDIGLIRLKTPLKLGGNVQTIAYPTNDKLEGKNVTAMGWGDTSIVGPTSEKLLYLNRPIIPDSICSSRLNFTIGPGHVCLGSEKGYGMCFGDSGSPLVYKGGNGKNYVVGLVSWGVPCAKGYPDVFTRVSYYTNWINDIMKSNQ